MVQSLVHDPGPIHAILGPTNTGKTHSAIERMLKHESGMIGLPLRLLAREVFDRVCDRVDPTHVALVTGEERITSPAARYWVCTVEAMPLDRTVEFLVVDEIQLAADRDRGHVFTDRILKARGSKETLFLGSETVTPLLRKLIPSVRTETRPRLSALQYAGYRKLSRLPRRTAVIAYRAEDVYALAEFLRRQKGGAAIVMGALSPRTRNAQVALFEAGEVDYLVATDAIGMGLNLNIDHVALAALQKFDGAVTRRLTPAEIGQVAGRAGRYLNPGSFGTTSEAPPLDDETVGAVEGHHYRTLRRLRYRNSLVDLSSVPGLMTSLDAPPRHDCLIAAPEADDLKALRYLFKEPDIAQAARSPIDVGLLWRVCSIPDFQQMLHETHVALLARIFRLLREGDGRLPDDFLAGHIRGLETLQGDIDTLQTRLAHMRTWTYISHQQDWLKDAAHWQGVAQTVENRLSDALHQRLTQRFVDRHHAATLRRLQEAGGLSVAVDPDDGTVRLDDDPVGTITGLRLNQEVTVAPATAKVLRQQLRVEIERRVSRIVGTGHDAISLRGGALRWSGATIARLGRGDGVLQPRIQILADEMVLQGATRGRLEGFLQTWVNTEIGVRLRPLLDLERLKLGAVGRGLVYRLIQALGVIEKASAADLLTRNSGTDVQRLKKAGVVFGRHFVFLPTLQRPRRAVMVNELRGAHLAIPVPPTSADRVSLDMPGEDGTYVHPAGFWPIAGRWYRVDALERLATRLATTPAPIAVTSEHLSLVGAPRRCFRDISAFLGYRPDNSRGDDLVPKAKWRRRTSADRHAASSPFAALAALKDRP